MRSAATVPTKPDTPLASVTGERPGVRSVATAPTTPDTPSPPVTGERLGVRGSMQVLHGRITRHRISGVRAHTVHSEALRDIF